MVPAPSCSSGVLSGSRWSLSEQATHPSTASYLMDFRYPQERVYVSK
jgi:hypothetical protein